MLYTVVIPCYKSAGTIRKVVEETMEQFEKMKAGELEFVLVDDCSPDGGATVRTLRGLVQDYDNVRVVELAKNAGHRPVRRSCQSSWQRSTRDMTLCTAITRTSSIPNSATGEAVSISGRHAFFWTSLKI